MIALGYDAQGNLSFKNNASYAFDYGNRLRSTANQSYHYDAQGRRVRQDVAGSQLQYSQYAQDGRLVWQRDETTNQRIANAYLAGSLLAEISRPLTGTTTTIRYLHTDALGSPLAKTSATGAIIETSEYEPYGRLLNRQNDNRAGYTGHVMDAASGLTYMQQRYYDPGIGAFLSVDPVTAYSNPVGAFNRYRYANGNPYRFTDPDGREPGKVFQDQDPEKCDALCWSERQSAAKERAAQAKREAASREATRQTRKNNSGFYFIRPHATSKVEAVAALGAGLRGTTDLVTGDFSLGIVVLGVGERAGGNVIKPAEMLGFTGGETSFGFRWANGGGAPVRIEGNYGVGPVGFELQFDPAGNIQFSGSLSASEGVYTGLSVMFGH